MVGPACWAASFDCSRATAAIEKGICGYAAISKLDDELGATYGLALKRSKAPNTLKIQQRGWVTKVRSRCNSSDCLKQAYVARTAQLGSIPLFPKTARSDGAANDLDNCRTVAHYANRGELHLLKVDFLAESKDAKDLSFIFGDDALFLDGVSYWAIDLNNDGILDHLAISVQGTAHVGYGYVLSGRKNATVDQIGGDDGIDLSVIAIGGTYYVVTGYEDSITSLWRMNEAGVAQKVCGFVPRKVPEVTLRVGKGSPICSAALANQISPVQYSHIHALGSLSDEERFRSTHPIEGLAKVDIDNDGVLDNVVRLGGFEGSGGRGCSRQYIAVTNAGRTKLPDSNLNKLLWEEFSLCGSKADVVDFEGSTYVDVQSGAGNRSIYRIRKLKAEKICEFQGRLQFDAVDLDRSKTQ